MDLAFKVTHNAAAHDNYIDAYDIRLFISAPIALFIEYILTTSTSKRFKRVCQADAACLLYNVLTAAGTAIICQSDLMKVIKDVSKNWVRIQYNQVEEKIIVVFFQ